MNIVIASGFYEAIHAAFKPLNQLDCPLDKTIRGAQ